MITNLPTNFANAISPFSPVGRQPVGEENPEARNTPLKPVEESAELAHTDNRRSPEDRPGEVGERLRVSERESGDGSPQREQEDRDSQDDAQQQQDQTLLSELAARDREVRMHERAHAAVGGQFAGAPTYEYTRGPDGNSYAISGEVSISTSAIAGDLEATIAKAEQVQSAALAPSDPSPADRRIAAQAAQTAAQARVELVIQKQEEQQLLNEARANEEAAEQAERERFEAEQQDQREAAERAASQGEQVSQRNIELTRQFVDISSFDTSSTSGRLFSRSV